MMAKYGKQYYTKREGNLRYLHTAFAISRICKMEGITPTRFLDVGCASGPLLEQIGNTFKNPVLVGVDHGSHPKRLFIKNATFVDLDLDIVNGGTASCEPDLKDGFDVVSSIEVIEHVDPLNERGLVDFLASVANGVLFISAAHKGQKGYGHVNCTTKEHWIDLFSKAGIGLKRKATVNFCKIMEKLGAGTGDNLMVFEKRRERT